MRFGRSGRRPGSARLDLRTTSHALTGPRGNTAGGPRQESSPPCPSMNSGWRPSSSAPSPTGLHRAHARPGRGDPARPRRPRRPRRRPDRHRQDGRVRAADAPAPPRRRPAHDAAPTAAARPACRSACLVLAPTRELALQVEESVRTYGRHWPASARPRSTAASASTAQVRALRAGPEIVVATPGRLLDHVGQRHDRPLARSRSSSSTRPTGCSTWASSATSARSSTSCPAERQNLLFSATFSDEIRAARARLPARSRPRSRSRRRNSADRARDPGRPSGRPRAQARAAQPPDPHRRDRPGARLHAHQARREPPRRAARRDGIAAVAIHGNKSQGQRVRALDRLQGGPRDDPRGDRDRGARPRHRRAAARRQLRAADGPRGLRPPDRPDRPRRRRRATPISLVCVDETEAARARSRRSSARPIPPRSSRASSPTARSAPEAAKVRGGLHARGGKRGRPIAAQRRLPHRNVGPPGAVTAPLVGAAAVVACGPSPARWLPQGARPALEAFALRERVAAQEMGQWLGPGLGSGSTTSGQPYGHSTAARRASPAERPTAIDLKSAARRAVSP